MQIQQKPIEKINEKGIKLEETFDINSKSKFDE
jgi:hypothetical protein